MVAHCPACLLSALGRRRRLSGHFGTPGSASDGFLEILRKAGWTAFLVMLLGPCGRRSFLFPPGSNQLWRLLQVLPVFFLPTSFSYGGLALPPLGMASVVGRGAMAVIGMVLVEQLYRNTPAKQRWGYKFACLGIGGVFAYDFYLYSDAMLFSR